MYNRRIMKEKKKFIGNYVSRLLAEAKISVTQVNSNSGILLRHNADDGGFIFG